jgi:uncharacterized membrane-anchored protein
MESKLKRQIIGLVLAFIVVIGFVVGFILYNQWPLTTGERMVLATLPVDPFDPFRGQYVIINYEISRFEAEGFESGERIYVLLEEDEEGIWRFDGVSKVKPSEGDFIKGEVENSFGESVRVKYGIEQFFFERGADVPTRGITVAVKVAASGRAALVELLKDGEPIEIEYDEEFSLFD